MRTSIASLLLGLAFAGTALGHGVQVQIVFNPATGKIETRQIVGTTTAATAAEPIVPNFPLGTSVAPAARVYVSPLKFASIASGNGWYVRPTDVLRGDLPAPAYPSGPGLTYRFAYQTGASATGWEWGNASNPVANTALPNLAGTNFTYTLLDGLKTWNGTAWIDPGSEQVQIFRGDGTGAFTGSTVNAISTDAGGATFALSNVSATNKPGLTSVPHSSVSLRLLGDGVSASTEGDDGIYLLSLKLSTNATIGTTGVPVGESDPFYMVLYKNVSLADAASAANSFASANGIASSLVQLAVPEPSSLLAMAGLAVVARRRR